MARQSSQHQATHATPARLLALELLCECRERDAYMRELVDARRKTSKLPSQEFAYTQVLAFGVVMCSGTLDELIDRSLSSPKDIKPNVRDCLRISAYELLFLKKPAHVVVDQGVELVKVAARKATGLANAVLHKMTRDAEGFPWGDPAGDVHAFARAGGVPSWFAQELQAQYGYERAADMLAANLKPAPTYLCENAYKPATSFASDLSAQLVASFVPLDKGEVLEIGAGRGTKTALMQVRALQELGHAASIYTVDVHEFKAHLLEERMHQMGIPGVQVHAGDARNLAAVEGLPGQFASVFADAPCSGTGTLRRHPEIRWKLSRDALGEMAQLQLELLCEAATRVLLGGSLVYATCSVLAQENQQVVDAFLASEQGRGFVVDESLTFDAFAPAENTNAWSITPEGYFASIPTEQGPDGHFAVRFVRTA